MLDVRPVGYVIGLLIAALGALMLVPMAVDLAAGDGHWRVFLECAFITVFCGGLIALACSNGLKKGLTLQQSFLLTTGVWVALPLFGALPMMLGAPNLSLTDAVFEAMSGMTTTGATVIVGLDHLPLGTNLWRGILHWIGGLGIVIVAMIFLPVMKVGGMQFFRTEGFDTLGKILPRALDISVGLIRVYLAMTIACVVAFFALGMSGFDAVVHALSTVSTGGFSSHDASFSNYGPGLHYAAALFMFAASLPFIRYVQLLSGSALPFWRDVQVRAYLRWTVYAIAAITLFRVINEKTPFTSVIRDTTFNVVSVFSGTGLTSGDVTLWGSFPFVVLIVVGLIGGCTASTGCSIKVFRYLVLFEAIKTQIRRIHSPNRVIDVRLDGRIVTEDVLDSVIVMFTMFIVTIGVMAVLLSLTGLSAITAVTAAWTSVANIGPAYGAEVGATGAISDFPLVAKWLMVFAMLLGRLELLSVFVLFIPSFWRV